MIQRFWMLALALATVGAAGCTVHARPVRYRATVSAPAPTVTASVQSSGTVVYESPPPPRATVSVRPAVPYPGAIWVSGHWTWGGNGYVWSDGYYQRPRTGYVYVQPRWERRGSGYVYVRGDWRRGQGRTVVTGTAGAESHSGASARPDHGSAPPRTRRSGAPPRQSATPHDCRSAKRTDPHHHGAADSTRQRAHHDDRARTRKRKRKGSRAPGHQCGQPRERLGARWRQCTGIGPRRRSRALTANGVCCKRCTDPVHGAARPVVSGGPRELRGSEGQRWGLHHHKAARLR